MQHFNFYQASQTGRLRVAIFTHVDQQIGLVNVAWTPELTGLGSGDAGIKLSSWDWSWFLFE